MSELADLRRRIEALEAAENDMTNFALEASLGKIQGYATVNKFGEATDADSGVLTDIWDGANGATSTDIWVPPTAARVHQITSTSTADTGAGTGMQTIKISYLPDWDTAETTATLTMNGTGNVATPSCVIIYRMQGKTWGTGGVNAGIITATADTDGTITAAILAGNNQTQMCIYAIPSTQKLRLTRAFASIVKGTGTTGRADGELLVMIDPATNAADNTAWTNKENYQLIEAEQPWDHVYEVPKKIDGPAIIKLQVVSNANGTISTGGFDGYVVTT